MKRYINLWSLLLSVLLITHSALTVDHIHLSAGEEIECLVHGGVSSTDVPPVASCEVRTNENLASYTPTYQSPLLVARPTHIRSRAPPIA